MVLVALGRHGADNHSLISWRTLLTSTSGARNCLILKAPSSLAMRSEWTFTYILPGLKTCFVIVSSMCERAH